MAGEAKKKNPLGVSGITVADNVKRLRKGRGLAFTELADRLASIGRPIPTLGLRKIEAYERRVDADDLVALAVAFDVAPVTLLMPPADTVDDPITTTGLTESHPAITVWEWLRGRAARPGQLRMDINTWPGWEQDEVLDKYQELRLRHKNMVVNLRGDDQ